MSLRTVEDGRNREGDTETAACQLGVDGGGVVVQLLDGGREEEKRPQPTKRLRQRQREGPLLVIRAIEINSQEATFVGPYREIKRNSIHFSSELIEWEDEENSKGRNL